MSRIHEALKKAALERSAPVGMVAEGPVLDFAREIGESVPTEPNAPVLGKHEAVVSNNGRNTFANLSYEEFVKRCAHPEWRIDSLTSVFRHPNAGNSAQERFRMLRSRLYRLSASRPLRRVLVTSGVAGEGKTFVAANLAQSIVQQPERRVLLIDADLRAPRLHAAFGAARCPGLTEYLRGEADEFQVIQKGAEENLCLVCAGGEVDKPSELLLGERMKEFLEKATSLFDWIIIDSPPALPVQDASDLARLTDGVLLVLRAGATHAYAAEKTAAEFKGKNLLGVVLNQIRPDNSYGEYYYPHQKSAKITPAA
jgi:capsular exopolysaccharide synthesis family protein